jgi:hypothetical protein
VRVDDLARKQLAAITEVQDVADRLKMPIWLRGGWAMDFYLGEITRPHVDVDWFAWATDLPAVVNALIDDGWQDIAEHPPEQQRDLVRDGVELGFAPLARGSNHSVLVGGGPWAGEPWPDRMLQDAVPVRLGGPICTVISPAAQVEIKQMMPVWVPGLRRRDKDVTDIARLLNAMQESRAPM